MNSMIHDALVLTAITLVSGVALGAVHGITEAPIAKAQEDALQKAYSEVFTKADSFKDLDSFNSNKATKLVQKAGYTDDDINNCVVAVDKSGQELGYVITVTSHAGYGGDITLSMGVTDDGTMNGYSITDIHETAGMGMKATQPKFMDEFKGIKAEKYEVVKGSSAGDGQIESISGATITSRAVTNAVNAGFEYYDSLTGGDSQ